ncbi:MAG: sulfite exporter TauE/SafE family protein [Actinomycetota bacterium]|nr:sulfite exporter TauE/SafE family protein [Actinomycetota bacterium]
MPVSPVELAIALAVTAIGAAVQGTVGMGFAVVSVPILSLVNPLLAPVPQLLMAMPLSVSMAWRERAHIERRGVIWLALGRFPGAAIGITLLVVATKRTLDLGIALSVLVAVVILGAGITIPRNSVTEFGTGVISGVTGMIASIGGPPAALLFKDAGGPTVRSTLAAFFTFGLTITMVTRIAAGRITGDDVILAMLLFPGLIAGYAASSRLRHRVDGPTVKRAILVVSTIAAVGLLIRALFG